MPQLAVDLLRMPMAGSAQRGVRSLRVLTLRCGAGTLAVLLGKPVRGQAAIAAALAGGGLARRN